jgi:aspartate/tyrosine/aromatic aminotransferase
VPWEEVADVCATRGLYLVIDASDAGLGTGELREDIAPIRRVAARTPVVVLHSMDWMLPGAALSVIHVVCGTATDQAHAETLLARLAVAEGSPGMHGPTVATEMLRDVQHFEALLRSLRRLYAELTQRKQDLCARLASLKCPPEDRAFSWLALGVQPGPWLFCPWAEDQISALRRAGISVSTTGFLSVEALGKHDVWSLATQLRDALGVSTAELSGIGEELGTEDFTYSQTLTS